MIDAYGLPGGRSALVSASHDRKHRPLSHPLIAAQSITDEDSYYRHVAQRIRILRASQRLSQRELGALLGVSNVSVCCWERERTRPTAWHIYRLERILGEVRP
jgi:DNA-binding transcriptional regulator YiaG